MPGQLDRDAVLRDAAVRALFGTPFADRQSLVAAVFRLRSRPRGRGVIGLGEMRDERGTLFTGFAVEVPDTGKDRVVCFTNRGTGYVLIDTFLIEQSAFIRSFVVGSTTITFRDVRGNELLRRVANVV